MEPHVSSRAVVGREVPLRILGEALASAAGGAPCLTLVSGEAGIGKTRLVSELEATARDMIVLHGECLELGGDELAYAPVAAALRDLPAAWTRDWLDELPVEARGALAAVLPREPSAAGGPGRVHELLLDLLGRLAAERAPVLLVLEDVHWADLSTLALLAFLARNLRDQRIMVVVTYRVDDALPAELRRLAAELSRRRSVIRIELAPLGPDDVARQLEAIAGGPVPVALARELHARAGGNPFYVEELFAARDEVPASVTEAVLVRVERLDEQALSLLAAAGGQAPHALLERLGVAPGALRAALDAGILVRTSDGVAFRHGLIGEVLYNRMLESERRELHRTIAGALDADAPATQHALQSYRAGLREQALAASVQAGSEAAGIHAYAEAVVHFERALELWDASVDRVDLLARAAQAARFAGDPDRAVALCREAIELTDDPARKALLYERLGEFQFWDDEAALECYRQALALLPGEPRLLAAEGHALFGLRRWEEARERCEAALDAGAGPRITLGLVLAYLDRPDEGEAHLRRALELAANGEETARAYMHLGELLRLRGDFEGALAAMIDGEREASRFGLRGSFGHFMYVNGADDLVRLGRWDEAAARVAEAERIDLSRTASALRRAIAGQLHVWRGDFEAARRELDAAADDGLPSEFLAPLAVARAALALCEHDTEGAREHVDGALAGVQDPLYTPPLYSLALRVEAEAAEHARARRRPPDGRRAGALLAAFEALAADTTAPGALAHLALARAEYARVGDEATAQEWADAAAAFTEPYPAAYARLHEAEALLLRGGDRSGAQRALAEAHETAVALGAHPLREAVEALARRARLDVAATAPAPPPEDDHVGLTAREADVLRLLADGLTNREIAERLFISQKTVGSHMAHIYGKLGVHSRVEAAGRAQQLGVLERSG
ncbi:MAG TPA: AAA family ATPase [Solirubrobacter sp.]|nr:AAA family ATPase [Solirubrobacter sp.]